MDSFSGIVIDAGVKSAAVLAVAAVVSLGLWRASAAMRHLAWCVAVMGVLALPGLSLVLPAWRVLPPAPAPGSSVLGMPQSVESWPGAAAALQVPPPPLRPEGAGEGEAWAIPNQETGEPAAEALPTVGLSGEEATGLPWRDAAAYLPWVYFAGVAAVLAPLLVSAVSLWHLRRTAQVVTDGAWAALLDDLVRELGLAGRRIVLLRTPCRSMPMTWGATAGLVPGLPGFPGFLGLPGAKVLLPEESGAWDAERRRAVLLHELAHVKRLDTATQWLTHLACALYWWNPLIWLAARRMTVERERACDDLVLGLGQRPSDYAEHLLRIATGLEAGLFTRCGAIAMARPNALEARLRAILDEGRSRRRVTLGALAAAVLLTLSVVLPVAMLRAEEKRSAPSPEEPAGDRRGEGEVQRQRVRELVYVLRHYLLTVNVDEWVSALKELVEIGEPAVPELVAELERADRDATVRAVAFALRAIGDPRAVPALIERLPRTAEGTSDYGGFSTTAPALEAFMREHQMRDTGLGRGFTYGRAVREVDAALRKITGHEVGNDFIRSHENAAALRAAAAERWRTWWDANRSRFVTDEEMATLAPASTAEEIEEAGLARFGPTFVTGPEVTVGPEVQVTLDGRSAADAVNCLDFDTGRTFERFAGVAVEEDRAGWRRRFGVDLDVSGPSRQGEDRPWTYLPQVSDLFAWQVANERWETIEAELRRKGLLELGWGPIDGLTPRNRSGGEWPTDIYDYPATFLFITREGGRGIVQVLKPEDAPPAVRLRYRMFDWPGHEVRPVKAPVETSRVDGRFGEVRERVLRHLTADADVALNLETGDTSAVPAEMRAGEASRGVWDWLRGGSFDVVTVPTSAEGVTGVWGSDLVVLPISPEGWDTFTPARVLRLLSRGEVNHTASMTEQALTPSTFVFRTRAGTAGMLRIVGLEEDGKRVRVRWKMVEAGGAGPEVRAAEERPVPPPEEPAQERREEGAKVMLVGRVPVTLEGVRAGEWVELEATATAELAWDVGVVVGGQVLSGVVDWKNGRPTGVVAQGWPREGLEPYELLLRVNATPDRIWLTISRKRGDDPRTFWQPNMQRDDVPVPGARLRMRWLGTGSLSEDRFQTLWESQWVRDGKVIRERRYVARLAGVGEALEGVHRMEDFALPVVGVEGDEQGEQEAEREQRGEEGIDKETIIAAVRAVGRLKTVEVEYEATEEVDETILDGARDRRIEGLQRVDGERLYWDVTVHDGTLVVGLPVRLVTTFDGERMMHWTPNERKADIIERYAPAWPTPLDLIPFRDQDLAEALTKAELEWVRRENGLIGVFGRFRDEWDRESVRELWFAPEQGWGIVRAVILNGADHRYEAEAEWAQVAGGWFPIRGQTRLIKNSGVTEKWVMYDTRTYVVKRVVVNSALDESAFRPELPAGTAVADLLTGQRYVVEAEGEEAIATGDRLRIGIFELLKPGTEHVEWVTVRSDGKVRLPFVDEIEAAGLTRGAFRGRVMEVIERKRILRDPSVRVELQKRDPALGRYEDPVLKAGDRAGGGVRAADARGVLGRGGGGYAGGNG